MATVNGTSSDPNKAGVVADNSANGAALWASANPQGRAVVGVSKTGVGLWGQVVSGRAVVGAVDTDGTGVWGQVVSGRAVVGAVNTDGTGVWGETQTGRAIVGVCDQSGTGVWGEVKTGGTGVQGVSPNGDGVVGSGYRGVVGTSERFQGVYGWSRDNCGLVGVGEAKPGVFAETHGAGDAALYAHNTAGGRSAWLDGSVLVSGDLTVTGDVYLSGADYAEELLAHPSVRPGDCVVIGPDGRIQPCDEDYDTRVAGIVSGAGDLRPAIVLDRQGRGAVPVALVGKALVRVDAGRAPVRAGDILTTSTRPGHAMVAVERARSVGAVVGKALTPLPAGDGLVKVLLCGR